MSWKTGLEVCRLSRDAEWFDYIYRNRRAQDTIEADVVIGPIANDTIFDTLGVLSSGLLPREAAVQLLMIGPSYTQVAIKTEKAAAQLRWLGAEKIERADEAAFKAEKEAYEAAFAAEMQRLLG